MTSFCTYFDSNFLPQGVALLRNLNRWMPDAHIFVLCMDDPSRDSLRALALPGVETISMSDFETAELLEVKPTRSVSEYCWTITPSLIAHVLDAHPELDRVTYVDADCWFFSSPRRLLEELDRARKDVLITAHHYSPQYDLSEKAGIYCVQFMTFSQSPSSREVLNTWREQCIEWCFARFEDGRFGDQKYLDSWPQRYAETVHVASDPRLTLAPWNTDVHFDPSAEPCMFHFHGLRVYEDEVRLFEGYRVADQVVDRFYSPYVEALSDAVALLEGATGWTPSPPPRRSLGARWSDMQLSRRGRLRSRPFSVDEKVEARLGSGTFMALVAQAVSLVSNVLVSVLIARSLGPEGKGALSVIQQTVAIALTFANLGLSTSNIYFVSKREVRPGVAVGNSLALAGLVTSIAALPIVLLLYGPIAVLPDMPFYVAAIALAAFVSGLVLAWVVSVVVGLRGLKPQALTSVVATTLSLVLVVGLATTGVLSVSGVMIAGVFGSVAGLVMALLMGRGRIGRLEVDISTMRRTAKHSMRVYLSGLADFLHMRQDILLLGWLGGSAAVGYYSVGVSFAELAWYLPNAVGQAIQAQAARVTHESATDFAARSLRLSLLITLVIAGALLLLVPWVLPALFGEAFAESVRVFRILLPGAVLNGLSAVMLYYQISRGLVYWRVSLAVVAVNIVANLVLVPTMGAAGAAVASTISYTFYFVAILRLMSRDTGLGYRTLLVPTGQDMSILWRVAKGYLRRG